MTTRVAEDKHVWREKRSQKRTRDCPLPLIRSENDHPWDDLFRHGMSFRLSALEQVSGRRSEGPPLAGLGLGYRYFLSRRVQIEASADLLGGVDGGKNPTTEIPLALEAVLIPIRGDIQMYVRGGVAAFLARTEIDRDHVETHRHLGVLVGGGAQFYVSREIWLHAEVLGFSRRREYSSGAPGPAGAENGPAAASSSGLMTRFGMTIAWGGL